MAKESTKKNYHKWLFTILITLLLLVFIGVCFQLSFLNRIYPAIFIAGVNTTSLTSNQAYQKVENLLKERLNQKITLNYSSNFEQESQNFTLDLSSLIANTNLSEVVDEAFTYGRTKFYYQPTYLNLDIKPTPKIQKQINTISDSLNKPPINAQLKVEADQITVTPSQPGLTVDEEKLLEVITEYLNTSKLPSPDLPTKITPPKLSYDTALLIKKSLDQVKLSPLKLYYQDLTFYLGLETALSLIDLQNTQPSLISGQLGSSTFNISYAKLSGTEYTDTKFTLNPERLKNYLNQIAKSIDRPVKEPLLSVENSGSDKPLKVTEFTPPQEGRKLSIDQAEVLIQNALLSQTKSNIELPIETIQPKNKLTNELGIKELIGQGVSNFSGSIQNRIYNLSLAASRINGTLIPPNEEFSFNNTVGDISAASGYKQAYVIKSGRTILDDGGGVCQVSTTVFRAALNSGLPITARTAHAYRVSYYEQGFPPGLDATIFHPSVDFKFKNNTPSHLLIQSYVVGTSLYVDLYGTSDGRVSQLSKPVILSQNPPLPEIRQDDPTLPKGTIKQVDWPAWGANVVFTRNVTRNGETLINETYKSNYRSWQAVYLVGTKEN